LSIYKAFCGFKNYIVAPPLGALKGNPCHGEKFKGAKKFLKFFYKTLKLPFNLVYRTKIGFFSS